MLERFLEKTLFSSQEDFEKNFKIKAPKDFNFGYDVVDAWAEENPNKRALCWTDSNGKHIDFTYSDLKKYTDQTASYFQTLGIEKGDMVMLILKRRYEFW
ncbi:MAG: AMP-binding protein, partial [Paludibacteraceae bacterium]|nr:AMP-binding protein [Paludibacteraceae bacterium]